MVNTKVVAVGQVNYAKVAVQVPVSLDIGKLINDIKGNVTVVQEFLKVALKYSKDIIGRAPTKDEFLNIVSQMLANELHPETLKLPWYLSIIQGVVVKYKLTIVRYVVGQADKYAFQKWFGAYWYEELVKLINQVNL